MTLLVAFLDVAQAWAVTHAVGRVTCPLTGSVSVDGVSPHHVQQTTIRPGFFAASVRDPLTKGMDNLKTGYVRAMQYLADTQCFDRTPNEKGQCLSDIANAVKPHPNAGPEAGEPCRWKPTGGVRPNATGNTDLNTLGGTCGMPQHFHGTITVRVSGGSSRSRSRHASYDV